MRYFHFCFQYQQQIWWIVNHKKFSWKCERNLVVRMMKNSNFTKKCSSNNCLGRDYLSHTHLSIAMMFASNLLHRHTCFFYLFLCIPKKIEDLKLKRQYWHWLSLAMQLNDGVTAFSHACDKNLTLNCSALHRSMINFFFFLFIELI